MIELRPDLARQIPGPDPFGWILACPGKVYREVKHRRTVRLELGGRAYFVKIHRGCGWWEILKDWLQFRPPVVGAETEWRAIEHLGRIGIRTLAIAGRGARGRLPDRRESFLITDALEDTISLETLIAQWGDLAPGRRARLRARLVREVAGMARALHASGANHRDFYLCHFLVKQRDWNQWEGEPLELHLIDLHRMQIRRRVPVRWQIKDLGGLYFSAMDAGLTLRDLALFLSVYRGRPARRVLRAERSFWDRVRANAGRLYRAFHQRPPPEVPRFQRR